MAASNGAKKLLQQLLKSAVEAGGYDAQMAKVCVVSAGKGKCLAEVKIDKEHTNRSGAAHGGFLATLVDVVSTMALMTCENAPPGVSVDMSVSYMKAANTGEEILINAEALKVGKTLAFLDVNITNKETGTMIAKGSHTKYVG